MKYSDRSSIDRNSADDHTRPARAEWLCFAGYLAISVYFTYPLLASGARLGISDWDAILFQHASVINSVYEYQARCRSGIPGTAAATCFGRIPRSRC